MFCHQCGARAQGNFCSGCGTKLIQPDTPGHDAPAAIPQPPVLDWSGEIRYDRLLQHPEVRQLVARHAAQSKKRLSAEQFLSLCDKALKPVIGVSLNTIASIALPIYSALGIQTGKTQKTSFPHPPGKVIVACLCTMAAEGQSLDQASQGEDGCLLRANIPSDIWSFAGEMLVTIEHRNQITFVEAATVIRGQLYDWGKSKRLLARFFEQTQIIANDLKTLT